MNATTMGIKGASAILAGLLLSFSVFAHEVDILAKSYPLDKIAAIVESVDEFRLYPGIGERKRWQSIPQELRKELVARGENVLDYRYQGLPASVLFEDTRNGSYSKSAGLQHAARRNLLDLVLAEAVENESRFLTAIVDIIWAISEESSWPTLSHYYLHKEGDEAKLSLALPDVSDPVVDLWAAETAKNFAWIYHVLGEKFDEMSPRINNRIKYEVKRRVLNPLKVRDDFWWMGFSGGNHGIVNNWNSWISSNWLPAILLIEDREEQAESIHKLLRVVDQLINRYADDGGLDEGPAYWERAGGSLFDILTTLHAWSGGQINVFDHPKVQNIIHYVHRVHIHDRYVVNFSDAPPKLSPHVPSLYHMGQVLNDERLKQFAAIFADHDIRKGSRRIQFQTQGGRDMDRLMFPLFYMDDDFNEIEASAPYARDVWFEGIQQMLARSEAGSPEGFFAAAKGGHNNESHNHNDVGNLVIYHDGLPVIIDVGPEHYTLKTFGKDRHTLWNIKSDYHTVPTINGQLQATGQQYAATDVSYSSDDARARITMDIASAYPEEAAIDYWQRNIELIRKQGITLEENYRMHRVEGKNATSLNFVTPREVSDTDAGLLLKVPGAEPVHMRFDHALFDARVETIELTDGKMRENWAQEQLYRIVLTPRKLTKEGGWVIQFTAQLIH